MGMGIPAFRATWSSEAAREIQGAGVGVISCCSTDKLAGEDLDWGGHFSLPTPDPGSRDLDSSGEGAWARSLRNYLPWWARRVLPSVSVNHEPARAP